MKDWPTSCDDCGAEFNIDYIAGVEDPRPRFCPFCGSEVGR